MSKITLAPLANLTNETTAVATINSNNQAIQDAIDTLLSRDGATPNSMASNLDMNSYRIQNLPEAIDASEPVRKGDVNAMIAVQASTTKWYYGTDIPASSQYNTGDFYLRTTTSDVYTKSNSTTWTLIGNFKGATGATGPSGSGSGDMLKATYDTNNNGIVDAAASVPWSGVTSTPTTLSGYGITSVPFSTLTSKPTTISGYGITDAQPLNSKLTDIAAQTWAADTFPYYTSASTSATSPITAAGRALLDDADAATQRTTLGLGTIALRNTITTGDITNAAVTLPKLDSTGLVGQVLTAQGSGLAPVWANPSGGAGGSAAYTLLGTVTATTGLATVSLSPVTLTSYVKLYVVLSTVKLSAAGTVRLNNIVMTPASGTAAALFSGWFDIDLLTNVGVGITSTAANVAPVQVLVRSGVTTATTSLTFTPSTGTFAGGTFSIYGVK